MLRELITAIPIGIVFGFVIQTSGVYSPAAIRAQFVFDKEIMMKMFLGALAGSSLAMAILNTLNPKGFDKAREAKGWGDKGAVSAIIGGLIQGTGMAIAGSCPGMMYAQLGSGSSSAIYLYAGGLTGAFLYGFLHPWLKEHHTFDFASTFEKRFESMHLERILFNGQYRSVVLGFAAFALSVALALDKHVPWRQDVSNVGGVNPSLAMNPIAAGFVIGLLQIPAFVAFGSLLGASSAYSVVSSQVYRVLPEDALSKHSYAKGFISNKSSWQIGLGIGIFIASSLTSGYAKALLGSLNNLQGMPPSPTASVSPLEAFLGGLLIVFGARFIGGCASGHGITGLPSLHVVSWFVVPAMFGSGILVGNILSHVYGRSEYLLQAA